MPGQLVAEVLKILYTRQGKYDNCVKEKISQMEFVIDYYSKITQKYRECKQRSFFPLTLSM
jgi:hypothetical protein